MIVYVAGPMRGYDQFNFPAFDAAQSVLESLGHTVITPANLDRAAGFTEDSDISTFSMHDAIDRDVAALKKCDAIYMLRGWEKSKGARAEKALAEWLELEVLYEDPPLPPTPLLPDPPEDILEEALRITKGDRNASYGPPDQDFRRTAALWSAIKGVEFEAREVALFMILLKVSRETHQRKRDNWVDMAGYARCGSICQ